jgi:hypothetical protein
MEDWIAPKNKKKKPFQFKGFSIQIGGGGGNRISAPVHNLLKYKHNFLENPFWIVFG